MYFIVTCKYEKDLLKNNWGKVTIFPIISLWGFFQTLKGSQLPRWWSDLVQFDSSELSCISSLPASMKRIGWKTVEKKGQHSLYHYNPICCHGNQLSDLAEFRTHPSSHVCHLYLLVWKGSNQEQPRKSGNTVFPIISLWRFFQAFKGS